MPGYFIYCRKSSEAEDRQVLSVESQVNELRETAAKLKLPVAEVLTEAKSAKAPGRPVFNQMMQRLYRGEAAGILCWKLDRLARNPVDGGTIIWAIKQNGIKVFTPAQNYSQSDDNVILMYIEFGMAQKYVDDLSRNVKRGLKTKVEKGWYPGLAPLGYVNDRIGIKGGKRVLKDPDRFQLVKRMWGLMLTGLYTPPRILEMATSEWGFRARPNRISDSGLFSRSGIYRIFTNPFYYGRFEFPRGSGQWYKGGHEPMVTEAEYDRVQVLLGRDGNPRPIAHKTFAFTGLVRCGGCTSPVTAEEKHQLICDRCRFKFAYRKRDACPRCGVMITEMQAPMLLHYTYYHCTRSKDRDCAEPSIRVDRLEKQIDAFLGRIQISEQFRAYAIKHLHLLHDEEIASRNQTLKSQQHAYQECLHRIDSLLRLKTSPGNADGSLLSDDEYGRQRSELLKEKARLEELQQDFGHRVEQWVKLSERTFEFACTAREWFAKGDFQAKKEILSCIGSNLILKDRKLFIEALKPFLILKTSRNLHDNAQRPVEPNKAPLKQGQNNWNPMQCPTGLREWDNVRTYEPIIVKSATSIYSFFRNLVLNAPAEAERYRALLDRNSDRKYLSVRRN